MFRKSIIFTTVLALSLSMTGCGSLLGNTSNNNSNAGGMFGVLSSILGGGSGGGLLGNVLGSVISNGMGLGFVDNVVVCFDGDSAGQNATAKSLEPLLNEG